ncbi:rna-directed dna polymerase from mobile element jockey-like [Pitangus sulphuratus]|nr:rna-directed dna polymerase from mobile element jockey-like [Pitangus sulphuratus]
MLVIRVDRTREVEIGGHLGHSNDEAINFKISVDKRKSSSNTSALDMKKADSRLLRELGQTKAEVFNTFFASAFNRDDGPRKSQCPQLEDHDCENYQFPVKPEILWDLLLQLDPFKSMRPDGIHPRILKELTDVIAKPLSMIFEQSWESGEVPDDKKLAKVPIFKKEDCGNYRPINLNSSYGEDFSGRH